MPEALDQGYIIVDEMLENTGFNCLVKMRDGWMLYNKNDQYIGASIEKYKEFSYGEMELFKQILTEGSYVVEVGANIGSHTLGLSDHVGMSGKIYAYEPQRLIFQTLCANMAINSRTNVYCYEKAASNIIDTIYLPDIDYSKRGNFGGVSIDQFSEGNIVDVVILDDDLKNIPRLNLLKVDAEGMEYQVLSGAKVLVSNHKPILYVENDRLEESKDLIELIQSMNYKLYWHMPRLFNPNNYAEDKENIFGNIASFNMLCLHQDLKQNLQGFSEIHDSSDHPLKK
ncbi:MAG: FkbM family methyltransferase [Proteobacteria bacterium]|nr:FkbM family methyltransferase [Pseudomonadota bacterium]